MKADDAGGRLPRGALQQDAPRRRNAERDMESLQLIDEILETIDFCEPVVRPEVVAAARIRLAEGDGPSAHDLAHMLVAELVDELAVDPDVDPDADRGQGRVLR